jgi:hypothetical protein
MAYRASKSEHSGAKHGCGAYWGRKADAKAESNKIRRLSSRDACRTGIDETMPEPVDSPATDDKDA